MQHHMAMAQEKRSLRHARKRVGGRAGENRCACPSLTSKARSASACRRSGAPKRWRTSVWRLRSSGSTTWNGEHAKLAGRARRAPRPHRGVGAPPRNNGGHGGSAARTVGVEPRPGPGCGAPLQGHVHTMAPATPASAAASSACPGRLWAGGALQRHSRARRGRQRGVWDICSPRFGQTGADARSCACALPAAPRGASTSARTSACAQVRRSALRASSRRTWRAASASSPCAKRAWSGSIGKVSPRSQSSMTRRRQLHGTGRWMLNPIRPGRGGAATQGCLCAAAGNTMGVLVPLALAGSPGS